ncbi:cytochrome P450 [Bradyrhizobium sp. Pear77]|uniref:cytochrome P450 n=1 Tax=Bradyrhizobium altum TaxID=1571202 RepID=UPI001E579FDD|nr:cytochrome P450 [Bradyrhizobium altum]MCC8953514.1 cytochrome P450 [Bradyrhizobium altum]
MLGTSTTLLTNATPRAPTSILDPYADEALLNPWPLYRELREIGPVVWLEKYGMFALTGYDAVVKALRDWEAFPSSFGMNDDMNQLLRGNTLCSDGDAHSRLRRVVMRPVTPAALKSLKEEVEREAEAVVNRLCAKGRFCATGELATHLPVTIVSSAIGLPEEGRERMMEWSIGMFNCFGPMNERARSAMPVLSEMMHYAETQAVPGKLKPGSWAEAIHHAAAAGEVPSEAVPVMMIDYMGPSLDTTIFGISSGVWLFAKHPDQWDLVRNDPSLIPAAIDEILRMEAPVQGFSRYVARDYDLDGFLLPEGSRAIVFYGAANRDPRQFPDPDRFDIRRSNAGRHMAFGAGPHGCLGVNLAKLEMRSLFMALAQKVKRFHVEAEERVLNNILRGFSKLIVTVE